MSRPTQQRHPWRATARTVFQAVVGLAAMWGLIVHGLHLGSAPWAATSLAVSAGVCRVMAMPSVDRWLQRFLPWLGSEPRT